MTDSNAPSTPTSMERSEEADARRKELELEEWMSPGQRAQRALVTAKDSGAAVRDALDLSGLQQGGTTQGDSQPIYSTTLALSALDDAADTLVKAVSDSLKGKRVLVTSATDLALAIVVRKILLIELDEQEVAAESGIALLTDSSTSERLDVAAGSMAIGALVQLATLFRTDRTVSGTTSQVSISTAELAIVGRLLSGGLKITHHSLRGIGTAGVLGRVEAVRKKLIQLEKGRASLAADSKRVIAATEVDGTIAGLTASLLKWVGGAGGLASSPLVTAASLEDSAGLPIERILHIGTPVGDVAQVLSDRFLKSDEIYVTASARLDYALLNEDGTLIASGTAAGEGQKHWKVKNRLERLA